MKIQWPTAAVLLGCIGAWVALAIVGKPIPAWMAAAGAVAGKLLLSAMPSVVQGSSAGSGGS
jgi:hypothetical protein